MVFDRNSLPFVHNICILHAHSLMYVLIPILQMLLNEYDLVNNKTFKAYALFSSFKII